MKPSQLKPVMLLTMLSAAVVACDTPVTSPDPPEPSFAVVANDRVSIDMDFFLFPPCNSEPTESHGTVHQVFVFTTTPSGRLLRAIHVNANGTGTGLITGAKYQWNHAFEAFDASDATDGFPLTLTAVERIRLIGQGRVPNGYFDLISYWTINANGEVTNAKYEISQECR